MRKITKDFRDMFGEVLAVGDTVAVVSDELTCKEKIISIDSKGFLQLHERTFVRFDQVVLVDRPKKYRRWSIKHPEDG